MTRENSVLLHGILRATKERVDSVDSMCIMINGVTTIVSAQQIIDMVKEGITESVDPYKTLSLTPKDGNPMIPNTDEINLRLTPLDNIAVVLTRAEAVELLNTARKKIDL